MHRVLTTATRGAIAAVVVLGVSGCGDAVSAGDSPRDLPDDVVAIQDQVSTFYDSWSGNGDGQQAAEVVLSYAGNGAYTECMRQKGYDVPWEQRIDPVPVLDPLNSTRYLREPMRPRFSGIARSYAYSERMEAVSNAPISDTENDAGNACIDEVEGRDGALPSQREEEAIVVAPELGAMLAAWSDRTVEAVTPITGPPEDHMACVAEADLPGKPDGESDPGAILEAVTETMINMAPPADAVPTGSEPPSDKWEQYLAMEQNMLQVEWDCAADGYVDGMRAIPGVIEEFEEDYADELAALREHWATVEQDARELGWSPDNPFAQAKPD